MSSKLKIGGVGVEYAPKVGKKYSLKFLNKNIMLSNDQKGISHWHMGRGQENNEKKEQKSQCSIVLWHKVQKIIWLSRQRMIGDQILKEGEKIIRSQYASSICPTISFLVS